MVDNMASKSSFLSKLKRFVRSKLSLEAKVIYRGQTMNVSDREVEIKAVLVAEPLSRSIGPKGKSLAVSHPEHWLNLVDNKAEGDVKTYLLKIKDCEEKAILILRSKFDLNIGEKKYGK